MWSFVHSSPLKKNERSDYATHNTLQKRTPLLPMQLAMPNWAIGPFCLCNLQHSPAFPSDRNMKEENVPLITRSLTTGSIDCKVFYIYIFDGKILYQKQLIYRSLQLMFSLLHANWVLKSLDSLELQKRFCRQMLSQLKTK